MASESKKTDFSLIFYQKIMFLRRLNALPAIIKPFFFTELPFRKQKKGFLHPE